MSAYDNIRSTFSNIANAIRIRDGVTRTYTPEQFPAAVNASGPMPVDYCVGVGSGWSWSWRWSTSFRLNNTQETYGPIVIGNQVTNCSNMLSTCANFNQPVTIPENVRDCSNMFQACKNFNQPVVIQSQYSLNCAYMFAYCSNFNQPITVPVNADNVAAMFSQCYNMTSTVRLPNRFNNGKTTSFWTSCPVSVENGTLIFY